MRRLACALLCAGYLIGPSDLFGQTPPIQYVYDELGRLVGVIDQDGNAATYSYDAVGNLLSITRQDSEDVSIMEFTPNAGPIGTTVTITGTGFSSVGSQNTVTVNGTAATVTSASATQLVITVAVNTTTGVIAVTAPAGSSTSTAVFTISSSPAPTISNFTPSIASNGASLTITGTNFGTVVGNISTKIHNMFATVGSLTSTSIGTTVPAGSTSGKIRVTTPGGIVTSSADLFIPPSPYTPSQVESTGRMTIGQYQDLTIDEPAKVTLRVFDGTAGQPLTLSASNVTSISAVYVYKPNGTLWTSQYVGTGGGTVVDGTLPQTGTYTILVVPSALITTYAGTGSPGYSGDGGTAADAWINHPFHGVVDSSGTLYFADTLNNRVRKIDAEGEITTVAGTGTAGYSGDSGAATSAKLNYPFGVALDSEGNLYIADRDNNRIRKVATDGTISTVAGTGTAGYSGDSGAAVDAKINGPWDVEVDSDDNILIADTENNRVRKVDASGVISTIAGAGYRDYWGDGGAATDAYLGGPNAIALDSAGNLYLADLTYRVRKVNTSGTITTIAGNGSWGYSGDGGAATSASIKSPYDVAADSQGNVYIVDTSNARVRKVNSSGVISTVAGNGNSQQDNGDGGPPTNAAIAYPSGVVIAGQYQLYIISHHRIRSVGLASPGGIRLTLTSD